MKCGKTLGPVPPINIGLEQNVQSDCMDFIWSGIARSAHDVSDGGLAVTLAEMCIAGGKGAVLEWEIVGRADTALFGEAASQIVIEVAPENLGYVDENATNFYMILGRVVDDDLLSITLRHSDADYLLEEGPPATNLNMSVSALKEQWEGALA